MADLSQREKILIVDDNRQNIQLLMNIFKDKYRIVPAVKPDRAIEIARSDNPPDIILLDILMPDLDGYEVCKILKDDQKTQSIPIIFVTAVSEVMDEAKGFAIGAVDYITKPFHPPMIKARVKMHLELKRKQALLEKYAFLDSLTEIPNRRSLDTTSKKEWSRSLRSSQPISFLMIDIDFFKNFNDTYGHGNGDNILHQLAQEIQYTLKRAADFVGRYGGEEFGVILPYTDEEQALSIAQQIKDNIENLHIEHSTSDVSDCVTVSIGVSTSLPDDKSTINNLIKEADKALYIAKRNGRNRLEVLPV